MSRLERWQRWQFTIRFESLESAFHGTTWRDSLCLCTWDATDPVSCARHNLWHADLSRRTVRTIADGVARGEAWAMHRLVFPGCYPRPQQGPSIPVMELTDGPPVSEIVDWWPSGTTRWLLDFLSTQFQNPHAILSQAVAGEPDALRALNLDGIRSFHDGLVPEYLGIRINRGYSPDGTRRFRLPRWPGESDLAQVATAALACYSSRAESILARKITVIGSKWVVRPTRPVETLVTPTRGELRRYFGIDAAWFAAPHAYEGPGGSIVNVS